MQYKYKVQLETLKDVIGFVSAVTSADYEVNLTNWDGKYTVSAKSMIGAIATMDWSDTWAVSDNEGLYNLVKKWVV